jgi:cardiolipin synthase
MRIKRIWQRNWMLGLVVLLMHVLGFTSSIHAVMSTRTSQGAIAWVISLNTFPYIAVPAYWVFGRSKFQGYVTARHADDEELFDVIGAIPSSIDSFRVDLAAEHPDAMALEKLAKMPFGSGNDAELLIDGTHTFNSIFEGIRQARDYVLVQFFIVKDDELGQALKAELIAKAKEGVRVYFLYDEIGSHKLPKGYLRELHSAGAEAFSFHTTKGPRNRFQINFRNHRKIVVVDGRVAWIGGHNVGDEYMDRDPKFGRWRDTHVKITGPVALGAQLSFLEDWHWATHTIPELSWQPVPADSASLDVLIVPSGPADSLETAGLMFMHAITAAQRRVWIASPYFVPDESVMAALQLAGLKGVDVRILIPDKPDHLLVYLAAFSYFDDAGHTGVKFYRYTDGFLHQKAILVDDAVAGIGTANFDNRSFRLNFEITAVFVDSALTSKVEAMFLEDFEGSRQMMPGDYDNKSFWFKLAVRLARLTAPIQ